MNYSNTTTLPQRTPDKKKAAPGITKKLSFFDLNAINSQATSNINENAIETNEYTRKASSNFKMIYTSDVGKVYIFELLLINILKYFNYQIN